MPEPQTANSRPVYDPDNAARLVLRSLIARHPALLSIDELVREIAGSSQDHGPARLVVDDGLAELLGSGLAHRLDDFVFASQAAIRAGELAP